MLFWASSAGLGFADFWSNHKESVWWLSKVDMGSLILEWVCQIRPKHGQVLDAVVWAIYYGLNSAWDMGCSDVVLEFDAAVALHLLNKAMDALHPLASLLWAARTTPKNVGAALFIMSIVNATW